MLEVNTGVLQKCITGPFSPSAHGSLTPLFPDFRGCGQATPDYAHGKAGPHLLLCGEYN